MTQTENTEVVNGEQSPKELEAISTNKEADKVADVKESRIRDEKGRYAKYPRLDKLSQITDEVLAKEEHKELPKEAPKEEVKALEEPKVVAPTINHDILKTDKYKRVAQNIDKPLSWGTNLDETWNSFKNFVSKGEGQITREQAAKLMENIYKREEQIAYGLDSSNSRVAKYKNAFAPYLNEIHSNNLTEETFLKALADVHINLKYSPLSQRIELYKKMGQLYGVPMENNVIKQSNLPSDVEQRLYDSEMELRKINNEKYLQREQFKDRIENELYRMQEDTTKYPHFNEVAEKMTALAQVKQYDNLDALYNEAVQINLVENAKKPLPQNDTSEKDSLIAKLISRVDELEKHIQQPKKEELNKLNIKTSQPSSQPSQSTNNSFHRNGKVNSRLELIRQQVSKL